MTDTWRRQLCRARDQIDVDPRVHPKTRRVRRLQYGGERIERRVEELLPQEQDDRQDHAAQDDERCQVTGADREQGLYPEMFVLPNGKIYEAGSKADTWLLDITGAGIWAKPA